MCPSEAEAERHASAANRVAVVMRGSRALCLADFRCPPLLVRFSASDFAGGATIARGDPEMSRIFCRRFFRLYPR